MSQFRTKQHGKMPKEGTYGYELYAARAGRRLPIVDLAKLVGVHGTTVVGWENNDSLPQPKAQERLAQIFDNPRLIVIKSATQQITDASPSERIGESVAVVESPNDYTQPAHDEQIRVSESRLDTLASEQRPSLRNASLVKPKRVYHRRKPVEKKITKIESPLTDFAETVTHDEFNAAMLIIRTYITQLEKSVKTWETVKELLKDEA